jgi:hypothetical protein
MRTGTSLLTSVLCSAPTTNPMIREVQYLKKSLDLYTWGQRHFSLFLEDTFEDLEAFRDFTRHGFGEYLERTRRRWAPCEHLVLKNPEIIQYFPELDALVEDAKFIVIVRDPRDTVASMRAVARKQKSQDSEPVLTKMNNSVERMSRFYNAYYFRFLRGEFAKLRSSLFVVRYEDLVLRTSEVLSDLEKFSGLSLRDFDPNSDWPRTVHGPDELRKEPVLGSWTTELYGKAVSGESIGAFRSAFTDSEIEAIERECQNIMQLFHYTAFEVPGKAAG